MNPIEFASHYFRGPHGRPWQPFPHQADSLGELPARKIVCAGRDVGKTTEIEILAAWFLHHHPQQEVLVATQTENHLDPLMQRITRRIHTTPVLCAQLDQHRSSPAWHIRFKNGAALWGRIAGPRGINFQGMHVDLQIVDEAQEMTDAAWDELYQALNAGGRRYIYGVPNGLRNTFHRLCYDGDYRTVRWPSILHPRFTREKDRELIRLYGGIDAPGYRQRVLGEHGDPAHAVFNLEDYLACVLPHLPVLDLTLHRDEPLPTQKCAPCGDYYLGCDLGYARDPSEFVVYHDQPPHLTNIARIQLKNVPYARQLQVIQDLDHAYHFQAIGIDAGNNGRAIAHQLMELGPRWCEITHAYDFGATIPTAPLPNGDTPRRRAKEFMTQLITQHLAQRTLRFPRIPDREAQYAAHTCHTTPNGHLQYQKGNDHIIDADRCALLAHYQTIHLPQALPTPPIFITF